MFRGVASIGLRGLEPPLCLLTEWARLGYPILSEVPEPPLCYSQTLACITKRLQTSAINGSYHETWLKT